MEKYRVRRAEVLALKAFLRQDGSDGSSRDIAGMSKVAQLALVLERSNGVPQMGNTFSELTLLFYGTPENFAAINRKKNKDDSDEPIIWEPTMRQGNAMKALAYRLRRNLVRDNASPYYSFKVPMADFDGEEMNIMLPLTTVVQFEKTILALKKKRDGEDRRMNSLHKIAHLPPKQKAKNKALAFKKMGAL